MMNIMGIILEIQEEEQLVKDWSSIQHSQYCIWEWGVDNVWLGIWWWYDWFMIIYDVCNDNNIGDSGGSVIGEGLQEFIVQIQMESLCLMRQIEVLNTASTVSKN